MKAIPGQPGGIPARTQPPPALSPEQEKLLRRHSLWNYPRPRAVRLGKLPAWLVYPAQLTLYTLAAALLLFWNFVIWDFGRYPGAPHWLDKPPGELVQYAAFTLLFLLLVLHWLLEGRQARRQRWQCWEWASFDAFRDEEDRLQVLGGLRLLTGLLFLSLGVASLVR